MKTYASTLLLLMGLGLAIMNANALAAMSDYSSVPPFILRGTDANVLLDLSIEAPMQGAAYNDQAYDANGDGDESDAGDCSGRVNVSGDGIGRCYVEDKEYLGIFDPDKCYTYASGRFEPSGATNADHECSNKWSGNFLNWATMTAIDEFRWALTGGNRVVDTTTETIVQRANMTLDPGDAWYPYKAISASATYGNVAPGTVTPYSDPTIFIYNHGYQFDIGTTAGGHEVAQNLNVQVKVCDPSAGLEDNCVSYGSYYKPEGLIQDNADKMRFALMGYTMDIDKDRDGGVLRSNMKYVGPKLLDGTDNPRKEFGTDGIFILNPESATEGQSGVISYLNKFGANGYKSKDPVGELFYECLNFYKDRGPTFEYYDGLTDAEKGGFPVLTTWEDPIQAWCQKNYIVGINDANPWLDKKLPGTYFTSDTFNGHTLDIDANDYGEPSNPDTDINVRDLTNTVGDLQGLTNTDQVVGCTATNCDMLANTKNIPGLGEVMSTAPYMPKENSYYVAGLAYYANSRDIRSDLPGRQTITTFMVDTQEFSETPLTGEMNMLWLAAKYGGFTEKDHADPDNLVQNIYQPNLASEWDADGNGEPDNYVLATDPAKLVNGLNKVFSEISNNASSGTAASVISNSRSGEGAVYQSAFYPEYRDTCLSGPINQVSWIGDVHALFVDDHGNMREDTNTNSTLDLADDKFIKYEGTDVYKYSDSNANGKLDSGELSAASGPFALADINYLWSSSSWLNDITLDPVTQRTYDATDKKRYIFTFIDDGDMVAESGEQVEFSTDASVIAAISSYLHLFDPFQFSPAAPPPGVAAGDYSTYLGHQAERIIKYIRGEDQGSLSFGSSTIPAMRSRQIDDDCDGTVETYRMGDVIHSSPTLVGRPSEGYDLIYKDETYQTFYKKYKERRNVVYVGGNDGMLHAFNAGFFDPDTHAFRTQKLKTDPNPPYGEIPDTDYANFDLGAEMWAYVPFNLLTHLHWLTDPNYSHVYYVDAKPKIFDARIYNPNNADTDVHPSGWATLMVCGMRFGGGTIRTDKDKDGLYEPNDATLPDQEMTSAYFILDITDPEAPPKVLAEFTFSDLGFTTGYPTAILMNPKDTAENKWYLAVGSGPIDSNGPDSTALEHGTSNQEAKLYIIDLKEIAQSETLKDHSGSVLTTAGPAFQTLTGDSSSYVSDLVSVDFDLDYKTDAVYFGTVSGSAPNWGGKLRRITINDDLTTTNWNGNSTLVDAGKPITAHPTLGQDPDGRIWVYFGTGRFTNQDDIISTQQQTYYGIQEPWNDSNSNGRKDPSESFTWATVSAGNLLDVSSAKVYQYGNTVSDVTGVSDFGGLLSAVDGKNGWKLDFSTSGERNIGGAALLGDILLFTTYVPDSDPCEFEGNSYVYALYYTTGTAYPKSVIGLGSSFVLNGTQEEHVVLKKLDLGRGLTVSPSLHTGRQAGSVAYIQKGTGAIPGLEISNPGITKSGKGAWLEE